MSQSKLITKSDIPTPNKKTFTFIRFSDRQWLERFQKGEMRFMPLAYYKRMENLSDRQRPDDLEGVQSILQPGKVFFKIRANGVEHEFKDLAGPILVHRDADLLYRYVFCLYSLDTRNCHDTEFASPELMIPHLHLKDELKEFGSHLLCFYDAGKFLSRVVDAVKKKNLRLKANHVRYFDPETTHGEIEDDLIGLCKPLLFSHQNEYRICIESPEKRDALFLDVGDLSDISFISTIEEFNKSVRVTAPDDSSAGDNK